MNKIGIIQGRLSPRPYPKLQAFPSETWEKELYLAKELGFDYIEWIFELESEEKNPLVSKKGRSEILSAIDATGIPVKSVCADYFLSRPFYRRNGYTIEDNVRVLCTLIENTAEIGAEIILLPVLEEAEIRTKDEWRILISVLNECCHELDQYGVSLGLETELEAKKYQKLCQSISNHRIGAYYDTGNCAACGYDMEQDMRILSDDVICVHVKDRKYRGASTFLGNGDTNLLGGVHVLMDKAYAGNFTLQTYFEDEYLDNARQNLLFMKKLLYGEE